MKLQQIVLILAGFVIGALVYAMDWQRDQDTRMSEMDKLIERQSVLNARQVEFNEYRFNQRNSGLQRTESQPEPEVYPPAYRSRYKN